MANNIYKRYQEGLIKSLLASQDDLESVANVVSADDFSDEQYKLVYQVILELKREGDPISLAGILETIMRSYPDVVLAPEWILDLDTDVTRWVSEASAKSWAKLLKKEAARYKTQNVLTEAMQKVGNEDPVSLINEMSYKIERIAFDATDNAEESLTDQMDRYDEYMEVRHDANENVIPSPYPTIDKYTVGWLPGQLVTIGARTSVGKSVIATQSAISACVANKSVAIFSLEMSEFEVFDRCLSTMSLVELSAIRTRPLDDDESLRFSESKKRLREFKLYVDDTPNATIDYIRNKAVRLAQSPQGLDMVIIDYLQLVTTSGRKGQSRQEAVAEMSRSMKILAKQLNIPIMILVQLNREGKDDAEDRLPKISDIRESAAIAADSDVIILIDRKLTSDEIDPKALFIIGKNRNGQPGKKISVRCGLEFAMFIDDVREDHFDEGQFDDSSSPMDAYENSSNEWSSNETSLWGDTTNEEPFPTGGGSLPFSIEEESIFNDEGGEF